MILHEIPKEEGTETKEVSVQILSNFIPPSLSANKIKTNYSYVEQKKMHSMP